MTLDVSVFTITDWAGTAESIFDFSLYFMCLN